MKRKELFWGIIFIFAAVLFMLTQFGFISGLNLFGIFTTAIMAYFIIKGIIYVNFFSIFFPLAIILIVFDEQLAITDFTPWPALLTALLLSIGFSLIFKRPRTWSFFFLNNNVFGNKNIETTDSKTIYCSTTFGDCIKYVNSVNFKKAVVKTSFGDVRVYFDKAVCPSGKADIYVNVRFGDIVLYLPGNWTIIDSTHNFFGNLSITDRTAYNEADVVEVTLHGSIGFGDVKVVYV
ncbi:MAG: cell wall-active antibiotics response protein [Clostridiales bacterium]|nr:cell wall-active antibiotics response protein [Clostridiales bacterium]